MDLKTIPLSYGVSSNELLNDRLKKVIKIKESFKPSNNIDFDTLKDIESCDFDEMSNIINTIANINANQLDIKKFITLISYCNGICQILLNKNYCKIELCESVKKLQDKIISLYNNFYNNGQTNDTITTEVNSCVSNLKTVFYKCKNINEKPDMYNLNIINKFNCNEINESVILSTTSGKIYSEANPNGTNIVGRHNTVKSPDELISDIINAPSDEQMINRFSNLKKYFDLYKMDIDSEDIEKIEELIKFSYDKMVVNNTGLGRLRHVLLDISSILKNMKVNDFDSYDSVNDFKDFVDIYIDKIENRISDNEIDNVDYDNDILIEFGLGFLHEYPDEMDMNEATIFMNELNGTIDDSKTYDIMSALNEMSEYDKEQRRLERKERREQRKLERKEQLNRNKEVIKVKGKSIVLTNANVRKAISTIKKTIGALCITGSVAVGLPTTTVLAISLAIISKFAQSKFTPIQEKKKLMYDLQREIKNIDKKISEMESSGDDKNKVKLLTIKNKLEISYERLKFVADTGGYLK